MKKYAYYWDEVFGEAVDLAPEVLLRFAKAQLIVAGADGLALSELRAATGLARLYGFTDEMIAALNEFDYRRERLEDYLTEDVRAWAPAFIYNALKIARADGVFSDRERVTLDRAAHMLGVDGHTMKAIEGLVDAEYGLRSARIALLAPQHRPAVAE